MNFNQKTISVSVSFKRNLIAAAHDLINHSSNLALADQFVDILLEEFSEDTELLRLLGHLYYAQFRKDMDERGINVNDDHPAKDKACETLNRIPLKDRTLSIWWEIQEIYMMNRSQQLQTVKNFRTMLRMYQNDSDIVDQIQQKINYFIHVYLNSSYAVRESSVESEISELAHEIFMAEPKYRDWALELFHHHEMAGRNY